MEINGFGSAIAGMQASAAKAAVAAHNIANVNTDGFQSSQAVIEADAAGQPEVTVSQSSNPGPQVQNDQGLPNSAEFRQLSNVDLAEESVQLILADIGYRANASVIRAQDEMIGTVLDILA